MKKVLFIVPHQDDELFVGGPLLINLIRDNEYDVYVFIATNGDYYSYDHKLRIKESIKVLTSIGLKKDKIIFGGYGDCWKGKHIYNSENEEIKESQAGHFSTYLESDLIEWHYQRHFMHASYTRNSYLLDLQDLLTTIMPKVIICVDVDIHRDHRCLSLLTEEALAKILSENINYSPVLLKKYAYQGVLFGKQDFFSFPHQRTVNDSNITCNPYYFWNERISYSVPDDCDTLFLHSNLLYKLVKMYRTQDMWMHSAAFINKDIVYWRRNTNNQLLNAYIKVSSGEKKYLNDFKLIDTNNVVQEDCDYTELCWRPEKDDYSKKIDIEFQKGTELKYLNIYYNSPGGLKGKLFLEGFNLNNNNIVRLEKSIESTLDFFIQKIVFDQTIELKELKLKFEIMEGILGIGEIEVLSNIQDVPFQKYLYKENIFQKRKKYYMKNLALIIEKVCFKIQIKLSSKFNKWVKKGDQL